MLRIAIWATLIVLTLFVYAQTVSFDFINLDDPQYVYDNPHVKVGVTPDSVKWAFTSQTVGNWVPLTMLSHQVTSQIFGMSAGWHHLVNVLLHLMSAGLLLIFLEAATGERIASGFVALVFAIHPLHVESVAWVAERKDVLSALFFFLALLAYQRYVARPHLGPYLLTIVAFGCGLMAKPMLVTFPFLLILLDFWPFSRKLSARLLAEKIPFFALSLGESVGTFYIQKTIGSVQSLPMTTRLANAFDGYLVYAWQTFWPSDLAVFYPFPASIPGWKVAVSITLLVAVGGIAIALRRTRPYLFVGWFWFVGMLIPVIGFVQTGHQSHADRYTYLPMIGISIMLAWCSLDIVRKRPKSAPVIAGMAVAAVFGLAALAFRQAGYWQNNETLYSHALEVTTDNWVAHGNLGAYLTHIPERRTEGVGHLHAALSIKGDDPAAHNNLGVYLAGIGQCSSAIPHFEAALVQTPNNAEANLNVGQCLLNEGRYLDAAGHFETALRRAPNDAIGHQLLGQSLAKVTGKESESVEHLRTALALNPDLGAAHRLLADALARRGKIAEAIQHLEAAQRLHPDRGVSTRISELKAQQR